MITILIRGRVSGLAGDTTAMAPVAQKGVLEIIDNFSGEAKMEIPGRYSIFDLINQVTIADILAPGKSAVVIYHQYFSVIAKIDIQRRWKQPDGIEMFEVEFVFGE